MSEKYVYSFGAGSAEGRADMKLLLGGKGANLAEMSNIGVPVPAGFTISTEVCSDYYENDGQYSELVKKQVQEGVKKVEGVMGAVFGDKHNPLLLSVRSGAPASMPGMMDTVLNLGLNDETVHGIIEQSGNERFGWDSYRRFVQMYGDVVLDLKPKTKEEEDPFEVIIHERNLTVEDFIDACYGNLEYKNTIICMNKIDLFNREELKEKIDLINKTYPQFPLFGVSADEEINLDELKDFIWEKLGFIWIYLKEMRKTELIQ